MADRTSPLSAPLLALLPLLAPLALAACDRSDSGAAPPSPAAPSQTDGPLFAKPSPTATAGPTPTGAIPAPSAAAAQTAAAGATGASSATPAPSGVDRYPLTAIKSIPDDCRTPAVILSSAPIRLGSGYIWPWARQAMLAHPEFTPLVEPPTAQGQVEFKVFEDDLVGITLVGVCHDGWTCNRVAAMFKAVIRTSNPQLFCGNLPVKGVERPAFLVPPDNYWMPLPDDTIHKCARLAACAIAMKPSTPGDPGAECQKAPSRFKLDCALLSPCAEVAACAGAQ